MILTVTEAALIDLEKQKDAANMRAKSFQQRPMGEPGDLVMPPAYIEQNRRADDLRNMLKLPPHVIDACRRIISDERQRTSDAYTAACTILAIAANSMDFQDAQNERLTDKLKKIAEWQEYKRPNRMKSAAGNLGRRRRKPEPSQKQIGAASRSTASTGASQRPRAMQWCCLHIRCRRVIQNIPRATSGPA